MNEAQLKSRTARRRLGRLRVRENEHQRQGFTFGLERIAEISPGFLSRLGSTPSCRANGLHRMRRHRRELIINTRETPCNDQIPELWSQFRICGHNSEFAATIPKLCAQFSNCTHNSGVLIAIPKLRPQSGNCRRNFRIAARIPEL